jgi:HlyD family secretion protein
VLGVVDLGQFEVEIKVPESFARDLAIGMPAQLSGGRGTYAAEVSAVSPEVVNGEVTGRLRFTGEQPADLRQNQRMSARILLDTREDVLQVERGPFLEQGGGNFAYVMDGDVAVRTPIRTGVSSLAAVEILDGLQPGDRIVVSGTEQFGDAGQIRIAD